jgi:hypothetical protein
VTDAPADTLIWWKPGRSHNTRVNLPVPHKTVCDIPNYVAGYLSDDFRPGLIFKMMGVNVDDQPFV